MSRLATSFVLGYHGCDKDVGLKAIAGDLDLIESDRDYDWLGPGAYFWESDPRRAFEWAQWKAKTGAYVEPFVVGAVIDLRNCLDLVTREDLEMVRDAHKSYIEFQLLNGLPVSRNR